MPCYHVGYLSTISNISEMSEKLCLSFVRVFFSKDKFFCFSACWISLFMRWALCKVLGNPMLSRENLWFLGTCCSTAVKLSIILI